MKKLLVIICLALGLGLVATSVTTLYSTNDIFVAHASGVNIPKRGFPTTFFIPSYSALNCGPLDFCAVEIKTTKYPITIEYVHAGLNILFWGAIFAAPAFFIVKKK